MYGNILEKLYNYFSEGKYSYPTTVLGAYSLIMNYRQFKLYTCTNRGDGVDFSSMSEGKKKGKSDIKFYAWSNMGHYENFSLDNDKGWDKTYEGLAAAYIASDEEVGGYFTFSIMEEKNPPDNVDPW